MKHERIDKVEDLINSDLFCEWVYNQKQKEFWQEWQADNQERQALIIEATTFLKQLSFQKEKASTNETETALANVWSVINEESTLENEVQNHKEKSVKRFSLKAFQIAASVLVLVIAGWASSQYFSSPHTVYTTNYGETKEIILPDNSQVILQANSNLKVPKNWKNIEARKVWLEGEAFFSVTKSHPGSSTKFEVQTNDFTVEVLGTQFDVLNRSSNKRVVLQEGKVRLKWDKEQTMDLVPNEMAILSETSKEYQKIKVNSAIYTSWIQNKLILNNTPLSEISRMMSENYGYQVSFNASVNQEQTRTSLGAIDIEGIDNFITIIEASYEVEITKKGKHIEIK